MDLPELVIDHLVLCVDSVPEAMDAFEEKTGVRPCVGGQHLGLGTHNALVSLGDLYLEILAVDPKQGVEARWLGVDSSTKPCLTTFCVRAKGGLMEPTPVEQLGVVRDFSRKATSGEELRWRLCVERHQDGFEALPFGGLEPFLVDWSVNQAHHPTTVAPKGCRLLELRGAHAQAEELKQRLEALKVRDLKVEHGERRLEALLDTPKGQIWI